MHVKSYAKHCLLLFMTQDFAKKKRSTPSKKSSKPRSNSRRKPNNSNQAPIWAWLVIGLLLAALITLLIYLANQPRLKTGEVKASPSAPAQSTSNKPPQPRFDFYRILKEQELTVPDRSGEITAATPDNIVYYLQAGSFKNQADADELRATLLLANLETTIEQTNKKGSLWDRVLVGPFTSRSKMAKARSILASYQLSPLLLKRDIR